MLTHECVQRRGCRPDLVPRRSASLETWKTWHVPPDAAVHLSAVPFDGSPEECLQALRGFVASRHRWELWEEVSLKLLEPLRAGRFSGPQIACLLGIWAQAYSYHAQSRLATHWCAHGLDMLQEAEKQLLIRGAVDALAVPEVGQLCRSCLALQYDVSPSLLRALAARACGGAGTHAEGDRIAAIASVLALHTRSPQRAGCSLQHRMGKPVQQYLERATASQRPPLPLQIILQKCAAYVPLAGERNRALHAALLRALGWQPPGCLDKLRGSILYLAYVFLCAPGVHGFVPRHQPTPTLRALLDAVVRQAQFLDARLGTQHMTVSTLEKDVRRVVDGLARDDGFLCGLSVHAQEVVKPCFCVDYVVMYRNCN